MGEASARCNQVKLSVNVWYDPSTSRVHISSNDLNLRKELHTSLKPGSGADREFRKILDESGKLPEGHSSAKQDQRKWIRFLLVILLAGSTIALMVVLDLMVASVTWRVICLFCACLMTAAIAFLLPPNWRKRLGLVTAAFVAASGTFSVFLISPSSSLPGPVLNSRAMATLVASGPFNQILPYGLVAEPVRSTTIGDPSSASKLNATQVPIDIPSSSPLANDDLQIYAEVEVYPTASAAAERATAQLAFLSKTYMPPIGRQTIAGFCVLMQAAWVCGGARGNAYAETTLAPGANAYLGLTQAINSALMTYAFDQAKLATSGG